MAKKVLLLHGWGGSDFPHWQSWLAGELAKDYGKVSFLKFSNFDFPQKDEWIEELIKELDDFSPDIVICHSLANTLWFHLCNERVLKEVEKLYLVAPPTLDAKIEELKSFFPVKIPKKLYAKKTLLVSSTNDPYMDMQEVQRLSSTLHVEMKTLKNAGHINADSGYGEWQWMLNEIKDNL